jgi:hypothetical protein
LTVINHFQTYSQRENHVTNNTMLMLRYVYRAAPRLLENVLQALLEEDTVEIGPRFEQQVGATYSIPDAVLSQQPLNLYVEAKHGGALYDDQLERHIRSIAEKEHPPNSAFLIGVTTNNTDEIEEEKWKKLALEHGITFAATTYREILQALNIVCSDNPGLREILDDYLSFIAGENLLPNHHRTLVAMLCGKSWRENIKYGAYFEPAYRNPKWSRAHFLGVYRQKRISHIGRLVATAICRKEDGRLIVVSEEFGLLSNEHKDRIDAIIHAAEAYFGGFSAESHRFYLVDSFIETDVRKVSPGGMMGHRYFDIVELGRAQRLPQEASSAYLADMLRGKTYE